MSPGSVYVVAPISSHKGITLKWQNGILSALFDRAGGDGVGAESGKEEGTELHIWTPSQEALSSRPLSCSPKHVTIITTQGARTKDKPKSGVQRESWPEIVHMRIYFFKSFLRLLPSSKDISIIVTILKSIHNRHLKLSWGWEGCDLLVLSYWPRFRFLKHSPTLKVDGTKWPSYNSFFLEHLSDIEVVITSCSKGKMGKCGWDGQQDYGLEVVGQEGYSLFLNTSFLPPTLCPRDPQSSMEVTAALPQNRHFEYQDSQIILRNDLGTTVLYLCILDCVFPKISI